MASLAEAKGGKGKHPKPYGDVPYADPTNGKYPLDSKHIDAAVGYFDHAGERTGGGYTTSEWATMGRRVAAAANKLIGPGHHFSGGKISRESQDGRAKAAISAARKAK